MLCYQCNRTALDRAVVANRIETVTELCRLGADVDLQGGVGTCACACACARPVLSLPQCVGRPAAISHSRLSRSSQQFGRTALLGAMTYGNVAMVRELLRLGASLDVTDTVRVRAPHSRIKSTLAA
jgi:ankyrin repeat protein